ncbi:MAG: 4-(cytidine 5'-diphospho)-2-C-methyl-D-erythritol kinase [Bacteroidales bacterium]|nr:4-(cytidine 5'-diphospho)-2-C-methyl-D-erythritol kinase [Bacteroidales bacterium]
MLCNAKINLGLNIVGRRPDGYHDLETVFYPVHGLADELHLEESDTLRLTCGGVWVEGDADDNLVMKAYRLLRDEFPDLPPVHIRLTKRIPTGAGLGGGSSDAAFTLRLLNERFSLRLPDIRLEQLALRLGADCPFFIRNTPVFATGVGEVFEPIPVDLSRYDIRIVKPRVSVSTREAFSHITPHRPEVSLRKVVTRPVEEWRELMTNDFEASVFPCHPEIAEAKQRMYDAGALYASMSGSGSAVYGIFMR